MNALTRLFFSSTLALGFACAVNAQNVPATGAPDAFIKAIATDLLATVKNDKAAQAGDAVRINAIVNDKVLPYVDLARMTQGSVGRNWAKASPEQQTILQKEFRTMLQRTYGGALALAKDATLQMRPLRAAADDTDVVVRSNVLVPKGEPISMDYRLEKVGGAWKVYDLNVAGSWLVQNYQGVFAKEVEAGGVEGLIKFMQTRNARK